MRKKRNWPTNERRRARGEKRDAVEMPGKEDVRNVEDLRLCHELVRMRHLQPFRYSVYELKSVLADIIGDSSGCGWTIYMEIL